MKRKRMTALLGAAFLVPLQVDAQRVRSRDRAVHQQPAPIHSSGRLTRCRAPAGGRSFDCRSRVVYSSHSAYGRPRAYHGNHVWVRADWGHHVRMTRFGRGARHAVMNQGDLRDMLGRRTVNRVRDAGRRAGLRGSLRGYWQNTRGRGAILVITMDRVDVAELVDFDRDGFVDEVFLVREAKGRRMAHRW